MKMRTLIISVIVMLAIGFGVVPAYAGYTHLGSGTTGVAITASGTLTGAVVDMTATVVDQSTGNNPTSTITFTSPSGLTDSGRAIKVSGGTNELGSRIIIYTDNAGYFTAGHDPRYVGGISTNAPTGVDGSGMVGTSEAGYVAGLVWGISDTPNTNVDYAFLANLSNAVYVVDKGHAFSFTGADNVPYAANPAPFNTAAGMDDNNMYTLAGAVVANTAGDGLYPQSWSDDYYDKINTDPTRKVVSQALYKNIATVGYSIGTGSGANADNYVCNVPKLSTPLDGSDFNVAKLSKIAGGPGTDEYIYLDIAGIFTGLPAQTYSTAQLYVEMVQG